jgi:type II restriction enzyme
VLYEKKKATYGNEAYKHTSELLKEAKEIHKRDWLKNPTPNNDHEQSWKGFKGNNLEKLIVYILKDEVETLGLKIISGKKFERTKAENLSLELSSVKHNLLIGYGDYGEFGHHLPDVDCIIYNPSNYKVLAVLSSKVTLRERIAQTGYWKIKMSKDPVTKNVKVYFITLDEDGTLTRRFPTKKGRAIAEVDLDGSYVMSKKAVEESDKVKMFDQFIQDLKDLLKRDC